MRLVFARSSLIGRSLCLMVPVKPIIEHRVDNLKSLQNIDRFYVGTKDKFTRLFERWANRYSEKGKGRTFLRPQMRIYYLIR
jgi:NDP-sugar pyrophosphorylase family protein